VSFVQTNSHTLISGIPVRSRSRSRQEQEQAGTGGGGEEEEEAEFIHNLNW
jgi:hypothetical protein